MEQKSTVTPSEQLEDANTPPPHKKVKCQPEKNSPSSDTTSNDAATTAGNLNGANALFNHQPTNVEITENQQPSKNGIFDFILPSEEDSVRAPEENLDPNPAGLMSQRTGGTWNKSLEEAHSAQVKERSLLGHLICSEETQKKNRIGYLSYSEI